MTLKIKIEYETFMPFPYSLVVEDSLYIICEMMRLND